MTGEGASLERLGDGRVQVSGVLDFASVTALADQVAGFVDAGTPLQMDLGGVTRADSAGLALLVHWMREARRQGGQVRFLNMPAQMLDMARLSNLESLLPLA